MQGLYTMARNNNRTATAAAANVAAATPTARQLAPAHKYHAAPKAVAVAKVAYNLTALGAAAAAAGGAGKTGKVTVMGLVAVATAHAVKRNGGKPVSGLQIVAAMRALPAVATAYAATRAGKYAPAGSVPCAAWCSGYVSGAARAAHGLLAAVTPAA